MIKNLMLIVKSNMINYQFLDVNTQKDIAIIQGEIHNANSNASHSKEKRQGS